MPKNLHISTSILMKNILLISATSMALSGCGTESKPIVGSNNNSIDTTDNAGGVSDYRVVAGIDTDTVIEPNTTASAKAIFKANFVHKDTLDVLDKYKAKTDIKVDYKIGCPANTPNAAIADVDYKANATGSVTIKQGSNTIDIPVDILNNPQPTEDRQICFEITNVSDKNMLGDDAVKLKQAIKIKNAEIGATINSAAASNSDDVVKVVIITNQKATQDTDVYFQIDDGTAKAGTHFVKPDYDKVVIKKDTNTAEITIGLLKADISNDVEFNVKLINKQGGMPIIASASTATVTIATPKPSEAAKRAKVNPTGNIISGKSNSDDNACSDSRQDCQNTTSMNFTKLDKNGNALPSTATDWACFKDENTGLIWETKTYTLKIDGQFGKEANANKDFRDVELSNLTYRYDFQKLGLLDTGKNSGKDDCQMAGDVCTTAHYNKLVNEQKLCGLANWRLPTRHELFNIYNFGTAKFPEEYLVAKTGYKFPYSFWTQSLASEHGNLSSIWQMYTDGTVNAADPNSSWSSAAVVLVSNGKS